MHPWRKVLDEAVRSDMRSSESSAREFQPIRLMEKTAEVEDWLEDVTCPSVDSTGVNSSNLNSSPQNLLDIKDLCSAGSDALHS